MTNRSSAALAAAALLLTAGAALGVPLPDPVYTFCDIEDNDLCAESQVLDASIAVSVAGDESARDCFYVTGKLQTDCVWDIEPKCAMKVYDKPAPCRDTAGHTILGAFYEPVLRSSNGETLTGVIPLSDRTVRLGVAALQDAFDGTINGLSSNGPHREHGEVTLKVYYHPAGDPSAGEQPDQSYTFRFGGDLDELLRNQALAAPSDADCSLSVGSDALRVVFIVPPGVTSVDIRCCNNTGVFPVDWDTDFFLIKDLVPSRAYCVETVGGLKDDCTPTQLMLGVFDKNCNLLIWDNHGGVNGAAKVCAFADFDGTLRFGVTGGGPETTDNDFDGLYDPVEEDFFDLLLRLRIIEGLHYSYRQGASTKDASAGDVNRYPRFVWDDPNYSDSFSAGWAPPEFLAAHGESGGYCLKVQLAEHVDPSERPVNPIVVTQARADINGDGWVNALDLALMLSYWGVVQ